MNSRKFCDKAAFRAGNTRHLGRFGGVVRNVLTTAAILAGCLWAVSEHIASRKEKALGNL